jgi:tetratricopeptide (TPR) repeat protein
LFVALVLATSSAGAQPAMPVPQPSPAASVSQTIGLTHITITYHRPGVKSRQIWGALVPYGDVWRAGANENTTIAFTDPVKIEGNDLPAGTYGLHMIPTKDSWTIIFSKNATSWGSFFYDQKEDALRVTVKPENAEFQEWLGYTFTDLGPHAVTANLRWEKLRVPFRIDIDVNAVVLNHARSEYLRGPAGFTWQGFSQAAAYCLQNDVDVTDGLAWIDRSIGMNENFNNVAIKSGLLDKTGKTKEAEEARKRALELATTEAQVNQLGYQYMGFGNLKAAVAVFKKNVADHPDSWNVYDSLGEAQANAGDAKLARENYTKALSMVKDEGNKKRITGVLEQLKSK